MKRKKILFMTLDFISIILIYFFCTYLNNDFVLGKITQNFIILLLSTAVFKICFYYFFKGYNHIWTYKNKDDFLKLSILSITQNLILIIINLSLLLADIYYLKINVIILASITELLYIYFSRLYIFHLKKNLKQLTNSNKNNLKRTMIIGAGSAGIMILREIEQNKSLDLNVVAFIDDDREKINNYVCNKMVYGPVRDLNKFTKKFRITDLIVACPSAGNDRIKDIVNIIDYKGINVMIMPEIAKVLTHNVNSTLRNVSINDLLGRNEILLDTNEIKDFIANKVVLVTGGGGSIGSEICRQILEYNPKLLIIFDIYENSVYSLITELDIKYRDKKEKPAYIALIGSVRDVDRLNQIFKEYNPNIVFHAAAHKHVPLMEFSPMEAIKNNVFGTFNVAKICDKYNIEKMVHISTDKAVNPTNVMGASKRICEMIIESWNLKSLKTKYSMVRFGNVLGSNGSVIPLFQKQIEAGGPITVTHPEINRFFMTIPEACSLVIQSGVYALGGEKFILDMGKPVKIVDLAKKMIQLSGLVLDKDIKIEFTGLRPGEKLYEELLLDTSKANKTNNDKIFIEKELHPLSMEKIEKIMNDLLDISSLKDNNTEILKYLKNIEVNKS